MPVDFGYDLFTSVRQYSHELLKRFERLAEFEIEICAKALDDICIFQTPS